MELKFRAWDTMNNEWAKGFFIFSEGGIYTPDYGFNEKIKRTNAYPIVEQERFILMQSTGLFDKNGVEIFEGDIIQSYRVDKDGESSYIGVVKFVDFCFCIVDKKDTYDPLWNYLGGCPVFETELTVIGNVYENPELVEET